MLEGEEDGLSTDILYGTTTKWNFWLGSPNENDSSVAMYVRGGEGRLRSYYVYIDDDCGLRPVIVISKSNI